MMMMMMMMMIILCESVPTIWLSSTSSMRGFEKDEVRSFFLFLR